MSVASAQKINSPLGGSRSYSPAELHSLTPTASPRRARTSHQQRPPPDISYLFPDPSSRHPVLLSSPSPININNHRHSGSIYDHALSVLPVLKYGRGICSVNLHPSTARDTAINDFLWRCAQCGEYDSASGNSLLDVNVLVMSMSTELLNLLRRLTLAEFQACILDFLSLIDEDDDDHDDNDNDNNNYYAGDGDGEHENVNIINIDDDDQLDPSTWIQLHNRIANSGRPQSRCENVETLARLCLLTPWKIPVYVTYVTPFDMRNCISAPININIDINININKARTRSRAPSVGVVHWKLFMDWQRYRRLWVDRISVPPIEASNTMIRAILSGQQHAAWAATETIVAGSKRNFTPNLLALVPPDVLWNNLVPRVLYTQCQVEPHKE